MRCWPLPGGWKAAVLEPSTSSEHSFMLQFKFVISLAAHKCPTGWLLLHLTALVTQRDSFTCSGSTTYCKVSRLGLKPGLTSELLILATIPEGKQCLWGSIFADPGSHRVTICWLQEEFLYQNSSPIGVTLNVTLKTTIKKIKNAGKERPEAAEKCQYTMVFLWSLSILHT